MTTNNTQNTIIKQLALLVLTINNYGELISSFIEHRLRWGHPMSNLYPISNDDSVVMNEAGRLPVNLHWWRWEHSNLDAIWGPWWLWIDTILLWYPFMYHNSPLPGSSWMIGRLSSPHPTELAMAILNWYTWLSWRFRMITDSNSRGRETRWGSPLLDRGLSLEGWTCVKLRLCNSRLLFSAECTDSTWSTFIV